MLLTNNHAIAIRDLDFSW